ncbi:RDD family protein (plasmid) [Chryseobacterium panacisoli]|uniref:RDD family protein n=1 Tax=Chryseobacterium panacisoli TaxID=1807141 RepID=A0A5D8ZXH3_9FLAO|nr:RDD family protein [Chryseobacterium panacisoli]TZF98933.1 RDD family protein [Chryseobacterium panacisoli]
MKISELKEKRIIRRPTRSFDESGNRIYNEFEYDFPYTPTHKGNETERFFAKVIDMIPFFMIFVFIFHLPVILGIILSIPCVIISGTLCEWYFGTTLGKKIFKLTILDDYGNQPGFIKSLVRNILCLANFCPIFTDYTPPPSHTWETQGTQMNFSMHLNNNICKTHIVKENKVKEVRDMLLQKK